MWVSSKGRTQNTVTYAQRVNLRHVRAPRSRCRTRLGWIGNEIIRSLRSPANGTGVHNYNSIGRLSRARRNTNESDRFGREINKTNRPKKKATCLI